MPSQFTKVSAAVRASNTTWTQAKAGNLKTILDNLIATNSGLADPTTQATINASAGGTSGGLLPAGTYYLKYSWSDGFGETLAAGESAQLTQTAGYIPRVTIPSLPTGAVQANIYLTPKNGAQGTEILYATGITSTAFDLAYAFPPDYQSSVPSVNSTGAASYADLIYALCHPNAGVKMHRIADFFDAYLRGKAISIREATLFRLRYATIAKCWSTAIEELATLMEANVGTAVGWAANGSIFGAVSRILP